MLALVVDALRMMHSNLSCILAHACLCTFHKRRRIVRLQQRFKTWLHHVVLLHCSTKWSCTTATINCMEITRLQRQPLGIASEHSLQAYTRCYTHVKEVRLHANNRSIITPLYARHEGGNAATQEQVTGQSRHTTTLRSRSSYLMTEAPHSVAFGSVSELVVF